jgi:hypothetical protein
MPDLTHYGAADIARRHEQHVCTNGHHAPGICVHDNQKWPCDARRLLDALAAAKYTGTLIREARAVDRGWDRYIGTYEKEGDDNLDRMATTIGRLRRVLDTIDGKRSDPLADRAHQEGDAR